MDIEEHYSQLLGINSPWDIHAVDLNLGERRVDIVIEYADAKGLCPECGTLCPKHDERKKRAWHHLDTMQFSTYTVNCHECVARLMELKWCNHPGRCTNAK